MRMRALTLVVLMVCAATWSGYAQGTSDSDATAKIIAMEHMWSQAYVLKDPKALERILDDTFVNVESDGKLLTKAEVMAEVRASTILQVLTESMVVNLHGDTAIVTGIFLMKGVERGKPFAQRERFMDTWLYKNGQWVTIAGLVTPIGSECDFFSCSRFYAGTESI
jgi:ketosteroid isomerase-like protein